MMKESLYRLAAFAETPGGGNPAGVWVGEALPDPARMQAIGKELGYSETAFISPTTGREREVRYFSPEAEVPFCGHATIATGAALGAEGGEAVYRLSTRVGVVPISVRSTDAGSEVSLVTVDTEHKPVSGEVLEEALSAINWSRQDLDTSIPPAVAFAGAWHLVLGVSTLDRLNDLDYDFERLKRLMLGENLTTLQLVWRASEQVFHSRNPFPVGGVVEDPATGAAAAALGGYLRDSGILSVPAKLEIRQGEAMGRPSLIRVGVPESGGIVVTGSVMKIAET